MYGFDPANNAELSIYTDVALVTISPAAEWSRNDPVKNIC